MAYLVQQSDNNACDVHLQEGRRLLTVGIRVRNMEQEMHIVD